MTPGARRGRPGLVDPGHKGGGRQHARDPDGEVPALAARPDRRRAGQAAPDGLGQPARLPGRPETTAARHRIVVDYLNSTLAQRARRPGRDQRPGRRPLGLVRDRVRAANRALHEPAQSPEALATKGRIFKQVLSLLLAQRRPSYYLVAGRAELARLTDSYLRLMRAGGELDPALARAALAAELEFLSAPPAARGAALRRPQGRQRDPDRAPDAARPAQPLPPGPPRPRGRDLARPADPAARGRALAPAERPGRRARSSASTATACSIPARRASRWSPA